MNVFDRIGNGWTIAMSSFKVINQKRDLVLFPILSGLSIVLLVGSFAVALLGTSGWDVDRIEMDRGLLYLLVFAFYVVNYFIVVFFNMALIHCARLYFHGEEVSVRAGLRFSASRIGVIFSWAFFSATVGLILKIIQDNAGWLGKFITGLIGAVWSIATFFVVPVIAYENLGPLQAVKRSAELIKQKWGESLGATFSLGLVQFIGILLFAGAGYLIGAIIHPLVGILLAAVLGFLVISIISAAQTIFIAAVYENINGDTNDHYNQQMIDRLFENKSSSWFS
jgi:hypothetical protein